MEKTTKMKSTVRTELDEWGRRKFHLEEHSEQEEQNEDNGPVDVGRNKSMLIAREENLNIEKYIGRIEKGKKNKMKEVFHCEVCNEGFKCDLAWITHLNSPQHNRKIGMSMKVKAATTQSVLEKLKSLKQTKEPEEEEQDQDDSEEDVKKEAKEEEPEAEQPQPQEESEQEEEEDDLEAQLMAAGLPTSFGSKKQKR